MLDMSRDGLTSDISNIGRDYSKVVLLKPDRSGLAEDEVGSALDKAARVQLVASVGEERVLESGEGTSATNMSEAFEASSRTDSLVSAISISAQSNSLAAFAEGVGNIDVVELKVVSLDTKRGTFIVVDAVRLALSSRDGDLVAAVAAGISGISVDGQLSIATGHENLLIVGSLVDEDALRSRR
jgi:hypothetical protein